MDIRGARPVPRDAGPPRIPIRDDGGHRPFGAHGPFNSGFDRSISGPIGIPNAPSFDAPPPALPPPRIVPVSGPESDLSDYYDRIQKESYSENLKFFGGRSGSNYGSLGQSLRSRAAQEDIPDYMRRDNAAIPTVRDEGYSSMSSHASSGARDRYSQGFGRVHEHYQLGSSESYDSQQLKKLDAKRTLDNRSPPRGSALSTSMRSMQEAPTQQLPRLPQLELSLPARTKPNLFLESSRFADTPLNTAVSPRNTNFAQITRPHEYRSPIEPVSAVDFDRSPYSRSKRQNSGAFLPDELTPADSYDHDMDFSMEEENRLRHMHIDDGRHSRVNSLSYESQQPSLKRRASSLLSEDSVVRQMSSQGDLRRRRDNTSKSSPGPRLSVHPPHGSISSVSSGDRSGSFGCLSTATSMTSSLSFDRRSPIGLSPSGLSPTEVAGSPFAAPPPPNPINPSPRSTTMPRTGVHQRGPSDIRNIVASPRKVPEPAMRTGVAISKMQGFHMCDCCPKKPKKFDTYEELAAHEAEKQYECTYCGNRFKNKNEAERHQNSLHVRRHSWSCSALSSYDRAFHESTTRPGEADTCGYCGEEFIRTGPNPAGLGRIVTDPDWDDRIRHLQEHHKFRECNSSKKFFRADHFRQHLKHSHAGTSGKWTNMLENACMMEEELPQPLMGR